MTIITISGTPGSGKSTVAKKIKEKLGFEYIYSGEIFRNLAEEYDMSLEEFGKYCEENSNIDKKLDEKQVKILKNKDNIILEGRLAGWLAVKNDVSSLKVFLDTSLDVRTKRIIKRENGSFEKRKKEIDQRERSEKKRYMNYYGIDLDDKSIYDIIVDTKDKSPDEIADMIISKM